MEDVGVLFFEVDVLNLNMGDVVDIYFYVGKIIKYGIDEIILEFELKLEVLFDEVWVGGWINMIIGCGFISKVCEVFGLLAIDMFCLLVDVVDFGKGYILV